MSNAPGLTKAAETPEERISKMNDKQFMAECRRSKSVFGTIFMVLNGKSTYPADPAIKGTYGVGEGYVMTGGGKREAK